MIVAVSMATLVSYGKSLLGALVKGTEQTNSIIIDGRLYTLLLLTKS